MFNFSQFLTVLNIIQLYSILFVFAQLFEIFLNLNIGLLGSNLPNVAQLCSALLNFDRLCSTLLNFVQICSTLFNFVQISSTLFNFVQLCAAMHNFCACLKNNFTFKKIKQIFFLIQQNFVAIKIVATKN